MTGLVAAMASTTMLFAALGSAYIVRRGLSTDWVPLRLPPGLLWSIVPAFATSLAAEKSRRPLLLVFSSVLVGMQVYAVQHTAAVTTPAAAFFAVTVAFMVVFGIVGIAASLRPNRPLLRSYWHYLNAIWILLLVFVQIWK
jgi:heme/copper-type cytochrome/quinol oxidase subunit 3